MIMIMFFSIDIGRVPILSHPKHQVTPRCKDLLRQVLFEEVLQMMAENLPQASRDHPQ